MLMACDDCGAMCYFAAQERKRMIALYARIAVALLVTHLLAGSILAGVFAYQNNSVDHFVRDMFGLAGIFLVVTLIPSVVLAAVAEKWAIRRWFSYPLVGAVVGILPLLVVPPPQTERFFYVVAILGGAACGLLYWLIAGRGSGDVNET
jgi:hypothetical protein